MADGGSRNDEEGIPRPDERERIVAAFGRAAVDRGSRRISLDAVATYAGVPRERVEAYFPDAESGLLAVQQAFFDRLRLEVAEVGAADLDWPSKVKISLDTLIALLAESDELARILAIEVAGTSAGAAERRFGALDDFADLLAEGREYSHRAADLPPQLEQMLVDGVASVLGRRLLAGDPEGLLALGPELVELVLCPYLGLEAARLVARNAD